jgi:hypothetical protein
LNAFSPWLVPVANGFCGANSFNTPDTAVAKSNIPNLSPSVVPVVAEL